MNLFGWIGMILVLAGCILWANGIRNQKKRIAHLKKKYEERRENAATRN